MLLVISTHYTGVCHDSKSISVSHVCRLDHRPESVVVVVGRAGLTTKAN